MPGNEVGDTVHNFFAQESLSRGQHSQVVDGNWPLNDNLWVSNQRQFGPPNSSPKYYDPLQSEAERGHGSERVSIPHTFNFTQTTARPEFARTQSESQQPNMNGHMYGRQMNQTRPDEANFLGVDTESDQNNVNQRGFSLYESQQDGVPEQISKNSVRPDTSDAHGSFDLFGGQYQMNSQYPDSQPLQQQQQYGFSDIQQLQQQLMLRKMQELQRQDDLRQLDARKHNTVNQASFSRQASGSHAHGFINGTTTSDSSGYSWGELTAGNRNWLQRASMQGSSSGPVFSPEQGHPHSSMGVVHRQVDQSLYGFPISSSKGPVNHHPHLATEKASVQQSPTYSNSFPSAQYAVIPEQLTMQGGASVSRQGLPGKSMFGHTSDQGPNSGAKMPENVSLQEYQEPQDLTGPSQTVHDKSTIEAATSSHDAASLDPDEEKILFGSDDNIWDAFGSDRNMEGGTSNLLDGDEFANGLPSIQSGSWMSLMQSAVAETTSSGMGLQEEWSGPEVPSATRLSAYGDNGKQHTALGDVNMRSTSELTSGSLPLAGGGNMSDKHHGNRGFQHHSKKNTYELDESLDINCSRQMNQHPLGGRNWLNRGALQKVDVEGNRLYENDSNSVGGKISTKSMSGHWTSPQYGANQPNNKHIVGNATESIPPSGYKGLNINESDNSLQLSGGKDQKTVMLDKMGQDDETCSVNPLLHSNTELESVNTSMFNPQLNRAGFAANTAGAMPNLSNLQGGNHSSHIRSNNHHLNHWKHIDSSLKSRGSDNSGKSQPHLNKGPQVSESSFNSSDKEDLKMHEMESSSKRENSYDNYRSSSSRVATAVGLRDSFSSDAGDSRSLPGTKQNLSNQAGRKTSGQRKFQYHPMGNLDEDVEMSYGTRQGATTQAMSLQHSGGLRGEDQGNFGHTKLSGQVPKSSAKVGKVHIVELEGVSKGSDMRFKGMIPGHVPNVFAPYDGSVGLSTSHKASQPSQNMLELLHKVDQSRDHGIGRHFNSFERNSSSEMAEPENSDGSFGGLQRSQSSNSQGIGLQLGPPSQRLPLPNHTSPRTVQAVKTNSLSQAQVSSNLRGKGEADLSPFYHGESKNDPTAISGQTANETSVHKTMTNFSSALGTDSSSPRNQLQNRQMIGPRGQTLTHLSRNESYDRRGPQIRQNDETCRRPRSSQSVDGVQASQPSAGEKLPASLGRTNSGMAQAQQGANSKMLPNAWTDHPNQQHFLANQARKGHSNLSQSCQLNIVESASVGLQNPEEQEAETRGNNGTGSLNSQRFASVREQPAKESPSTNVSSAKDSVIKPLSDASSVNPTATQKDLEAFGRSLKPNNFHQNYSFANQMKAMKNKDNDPSNGVESDTLLSGQQAAPEHNNMVGDASTCLQPGSIPSKDMCALGQNESQSCIHGNGIAPVKVENPHISPQMAPSWFDQYGTFKNDQIMSWRVDTGKAMEQQSSVGGVSGSLETHTSKEQGSAAAVDSDQGGVIWKNPAPPLLAIEQFSSPLPTNVGVQNLVSSRPKKRKRTTADLNSWLKEVLGNFKNLQGICIAAVEWSRAANRLMEKVEDDGEVIEDIIPMPKPRRRIILTTHLMQQLLRPPPTAILLTDATKNYDSVAFYTARLVLGDACSLVSCARNSSGLPHGGANSLSDKSDKSEKIDDHRLSQVTEDYVSKARKLENDFLRLDNRASILDLRVECQDIEKFTAINRFARFHGRDMVASMPNPFAQRYVTAVPLPQNLPDRVQCLSL